MNADGPTVDAGVEVVVMLEYVDGSVEADEEVDAVCSKGIL